MSSTHALLIFAMEAGRISVFRAKTTAVPGELNFSSCAKLPLENGVKSPWRLQAIYHDYATELNLVYIPVGWDTPYLHSLGQFLQSPTFQRPFENGNSYTTRCTPSILALQNAVYIAFAGHKAEKGFFDFIFGSKKSSFGAVKLARRPSDKANLVSWGDYAISGEMLKIGWSKLIYPSDTPDSKFNYVYSLQAGFREGDPSNWQLHIDTMTTDNFVQVTEDTKKVRLWTRFLVDDKLPMSMSESWDNFGIPHPSAIFLYDKQGDKYWMYIFLNLSQMVMRYFRIPLHLHGSLQGSRVYPEDIVDIDFKTFYKLAWPTNRHVDAIVYEERVWIIITGGRYISCPVPSDGRLPDANGWTDTNGRLPDNLGIYDTDFYPLVVPNGFIDG